MKKYLFFAAFAILALAACKKDPVASVSADVETIEAPSAGKTVKINLEANYAWAATIAGDASIIVDPDQGTGNAEVTITVNENLSDGPVAGTVTFSAKGGGSTATTVINITQEALTSVAYGGVNYKVKKLADGNFWFVENLRYVPEGKTVTTDLTAIANGVWYPVATTVNGTKVTGVLTDNADTVAVKGYLYNVEAALGVAAGTVTTENCMSFEGAQGICPDGWHLPTVDEIANLVGRVANTKYDLKADPGPVTTAPYWDVDAGKALIKKANADGFPVEPLTGWVSAGATATSGSVVAMMSYFISSSAYVKDGVFKNQFFAIMANRTAGSCEGACMNYRGGAPVRCIKNTK